MCYIAVRGLWKSGEVYFHKPGSIEDVIVIKVPPPKLRQKVGNTTDIKEYVVVGSRTASTICNVLRRHGYNMTSFERILDFACGCGRTLNFLRLQADQKALYGTDCDAELVSWCSRNLQFVQTSLNDPLPPTPFPDAHFDLIYAISFFTHITARDQLQWLQEWRRILKRDGLLLLTVHGPRLAARNSVVVPRSGFAFHVYGSEFNKHVSYQTPEFSQREWQGIFNIFEYQELGLADHQDMILLGTDQSLQRRKAVSEVRLPSELLLEYRRRRDLQEVFDETGLGRPNTTWRNLSLTDWALFYGGHEVESLRSLAFESMYETIECE